MDDFIKMLVVLLKLIRIVGTNAFKEHFLNKLEIMEVIAKSVDSIHI
eukprot:SAG11_NODE_39019_length_243_cov_4.263889_2_plen_46_part_01